VKARPATLKRALRGSIVTAVVAGVLAVSGCATADTAAIVNGDRISEQEVQEAVQQIQEAKPGVQLDTASAVRVLVFAPFVNAVADKVGKGVSDSQAAGFLGGSTDYNRSTLNVVKASLVLDQNNPNPLTSAEQSEFATALAHAHVELNPRYGKFDPKNLTFEATSPNWIKAEPTTPAPQG
jgi:hypothetical protein